ncbi:MAG: UvrD-helicase domain-containing protein [Candidatus Wenzhouxiangella sp. M2_3B_020]
MSDREQRLAAVEPQRSVIVQAPAGSGKTTLLVERFLALLDVVEAPEEILAITFTRKAAAEMRERILRFLEPGFSTDAPHEQAALDKARAIADKAAEWDLAANPQRLMIRTIDSFSHYLARTMPVASRLGPVPAPADNTTALYRRAARRVLDAVDNDELSADLSLVLLWRDHRTRDVEDLLVGLLGKREQWLRALGVTGAPDRALLERVLESVVVDRLRAAREALDAALARAGFDGARLVGLAAFAADTLRGERRASDITAYSDVHRLPAADADDLALWRALGELLLTRTGTVRKSVSIATGFPPKTTEKAAMGSFLDAVADDEELAMALDRARALPEPRYADEQWRVLEALVRILERAAGELQLVFAESGQTDFTGLSAAALEGLGDEESGFTDLGLYLDRRIGHILVDEYQDTNWAQFHLLGKLTHGWQSGDGRTLFVVGDPMQSIYRFREAEVGLFMRTRDEGLAGLELEPLRLTRNFRSRAEIVDWVNTGLGPAFPTDENVAAGAVRYARSETGRAAGGSVETIACPDAVAEADALAETVADALESHRDDPDWRAAIIVRARSHLADILPALKVRGVPFRAVKLDPLLERPVALDLLALMRAILLPADRSALLAVLRSPVCGLMLADLAHLAGDGRDPHDEHALARLSDDGRARAARVFDCLRDARRRIGRRSLRELVEGAWHRLGGPQCLSRPETELREAELLLATLATAEAQGLVDDLNDLFELLDGCHTEGDPAREDVKLEILTMHGAKGLEWDLVAIPGLNRGTRGPDRDLLYWLPFTPEAGDEQVLLAPLRAADQSADSPLIDLIRGEQKQRDAYENQRLLYVATTRARERLILSATLDPEKPEPTRGSLLEILWPQNNGRFLDSLDAFDLGETPVTETEAEAEAEAATMPDQVLRRVPSGWAPPIGEKLAWQPARPPREHAVEIEFNWAGQQARRTGTVLHQMLERVGRIGIENLGDAERRGLVRRIPGLLRALGTGPDRLDKAVAVVQAAFARTLDSETGRWILSSEHRDADCELAVSGIVEGELVNAVIDRTFVDENGTRWIIDYKSGHHEGGDLEDFLAEEAERYETQLALYRRLFELMGETDVRAALYLPRHDELRVA